MSKNRLALTTVKYVKSHSGQWVDIGDIGCVYTAAAVLLNVPESGLFADFIKQLKNYTCFHW